MKQRYLLASPVPFERDPDGRIWLDDLWWQDLSAHFSYLEHLTVLAPCQQIAAAAPGMVEAVAPKTTQLEFVEIFPAGGLSKMLRHLPSAITRSWKAIGRADLVHSGVAGWPIPVGLIANPIAVLRGKPLLIVIESAFWRLQRDSAPSWKGRLRAWLTERFARWSLRQSTLATYTHAGYRESLPVGPKGRSAVLPASWISDSDIISPSAAETVWRDKPARPRFLLASRLVPEKGVQLFIDALRLLDRTGHAIDIDVIGTGPLRSDIEAIAANAKALRIRLLDPVPYGPEFMQLLRTYHATIVPLTGDEQARILYDSFSQAVPVIATDTDGNREVVSNGETGFLFPADNPKALSDALAYCAENPGILRRMGLAAPKIAAGYTHADMHRKRADLLRTVLAIG